MSKTKGVVKLVVNTDTDPTPQEPSLVENETSGIFVHSTNSSVASRLWFSQGTSLSSSFSKLEFDTDFGLKIHTENPVNVLHDASIRFGTRGSERWKIEGLNGSSGDLLPATDNSLKIGRAGFNLNSIFSRQLISDDTLALAASGATKWNIDTSGHFVPTATTQNIGSSGSYLSFVYANQLLAGTGQALYLGSNAGIYKWYIANSSNAALVPNTAGAFDLGASASRVGTLYSTSINNSGTLTTDTIDSSSGIITDVIQTRTTASSLSIKTGTSYPTRVTINSSGNVGIGTTSPSVLLDLASSDPEVRLSRPSIPSGTVDVRLATGNDVGIFGTYSNHSIILTTNGTEKLRILQNGRVGISNISPTRQLDINGDFRTSSSGAGDLSITHTNLGGNLISNVLSASGVALSLGADGSEAIRVDTSNKVGIGVSSPVARLQVAGNFQIGSSATATNNWHFAAEGGDGKLHLYNGNYGAGASRISITSAGNVGIGITSPASQLHVVGNTTMTGFVSAAPLSVIHDNAYNGNFISTKPVASAQHINFIRSGTSAWSLGFVYNTSNFAIGAASLVDSGFTNPAFVITASNNVGINVPSPAGTLHAHATSGDGVLHITNSSTGNTGTDGFSLVSHSSLDAFVFQRESASLIFATSATERMRISSVGDVGIGTSNPSYKLDCPFLSRIGNNLIDAGSIEINSLGTGNRDAFIDFHAAGSAPSVDYNFRIIRELGVNGDAVFVNKGLGRFGFTLEEDTTPRTLEFNARGSGPAGFEIAYDAGLNSNPNNDSLLIRRSSQTTTSGGLMLYNANAITSGTFTYSEIDMRGDGSLYIDIGDGLGVQSGLTLFTNGRIELSSFSGGIFVDAASGAVAPSVPNLNLGGNTSRWGTVYYTTLNPPSDIRLKKDIKDIETAKHIIQSVKPKEFTWKNNNRKTAGFIAQEFVNVLPIGVAVGSDESVSVEDSAFESWSIDPFIMVPYLTKALQEAFEEIKQLRQELTELKNK